MKFILYICVCFLITSITSQEFEKTSEFDILLNALVQISSDDIEEVETETLDGNNMTTYEIKNTITIPLLKLEYKNAKITYPFIINTVLNLNEVKSNLFSIKDDLGHIKLGVSFTKASKYMIRIGIESDSFAEGSVSFDVLNSTFTKHKWTRLLVYVQEDSVSLWPNCKKLKQENILKLEDIEFNDKLTLVLGQSRTSKPMGAIQEIKIQPKADESTIDLICSDYELPDSAKAKISAGESSDTPKAEYLKTFGDLASDGSVLRGLEKGEKGDQGQKGDAGKFVTGPQGAQGIPGVQGPPGIQGLRGEIGKCECSEATVSILLKTMPEMRGAPGERGARGDTGEPGATGLTGKQGNPGDRGPPGLDGTSGEDGSPGRDGAPGPVGEPGKDGNRGLPGPTGLLGPPGPPGPMPKETERAKEIATPGEKGEQGPIGPPGPSGLIGPTGDKGLKGETGTKGEQGEKGHKGAEGPRGEKGDQGDAGVDGIPGLPGTHGRPAEMGQKGEKGETGATGPAGLPAKLTSLLEKEMNPIEKAEITELLRGLKGQKGDGGERGDIGDQGPIGPQGTDGKDGRDGTHGERGAQGPKGDIGPIGPRGHKGNTGEPGPPGNVPTTAISLMKGPKGDRGHPGKIGARGPYGPTGKPGPAGRTGPAGAKGNTGSQGPMGHKGIEGKKGSTGEKGEKGDRAMPLDLTMLKGDKGERGDTGPVGPMGPQGPPGAASNHTPIAGSPGPPGPPGPPGLSIIGPKGEPAAISNSIYYGFDNHDEEEDFYAAATLVFRSRTALIKMGSIWNTQPPTTTTMHTPPDRGPFVSPTVIPTTTVRPRKERFASNYLRMIAINDPYSGIMLSPTNRSGLFAVNDDCMRQAQKYGLPGSFQAFLSYKHDSLQHLVREGYRHLPVVNLFGDQLFDSWSSLFDGSGAALPKSANIYSFNRKNIFIDPTWPEKIVWHGGNSLDVRPKVNCNDWRSESPKDYGAASSLQTNRLLAQEMYSCDSKLIVLCIEASPSHLRRQRHTQMRRRRKFVENNRL